MPGQHLKPSGDALTALVAADLQCALDRGANAAELAMAAIHATLTEAVILSELQASTFAASMDRLPELSTPWHYERGRRDGALHCIQGLLGMQFAWWIPGHPNNPRSPYCGG